MIMRPAPSSVIESGAPPASGEDRKASGVEEQGEEMRAESRGVYANIRAHALGL
jgi:hypothetical protein